MGQEIDNAQFGAADFEAFRARLDEEQALLHAQLANGSFSSHAPVGGLELEAWLVDRDGAAQPKNDAFLEAAANPDVVHELAQFNVELNVPPSPLSGDGLGALERSLARTWSECQRVAGGLGLGLVAIGILPTIRNVDLCLANMSTSKRYKALNEQILRLRGGRPIDLQIIGTEHLRSEHTDVMIEAAATSFQIHLQVPVAQALRAYNAALIVSAATTGVAVNSPLLFGKRLWAETRIPLFERAVGASAPMRRVSFGSGYARATVEELFTENRAFYEPIIPAALGRPAGEFAHLRLHNGTVWRWNRPLLGTDADGTPHLRLEHRPLPAGPGIADLMANMAFFYGLVGWYMRLPEAPEAGLPFTTAKQNFYEAARLGLSARIDWFGGERLELRRLVLGSLLPLARAGLESFGVSSSLIDRHLAVIEERAASGRTGAAWQLAFIDRHGPDFAALVRAYRERSDSGDPVHRWPD